ncbi:methyltransferase domain-containing protein [Amycolatopsis sp. NPDC051128]|uniref:class I SAM-dependent methyltransferase n=1 Tax=Amycolatopsis sp. NPDC051128 TaxID=3155412 RepID=UPI00343F958D
MQAAADALPMVLGTVPDVDRVLAELVRVLRPGGRLLFCEHVRAEDPKLERRQERLAGPWAGSVRRPRPGTSRPVRAPRRRRR